MLPDNPVILTARINLLQSPSAPHGPHQLHKHMRMFVCKVSGCNMQTKAFQMKLLTPSCHQGDLKQRKRTPPTFASGESLQLRGIKIPLRRLSPHKCLPMLEVTLMLYEGDEPSYVYFSQCSFCYVACLIARTFCCAVASGTRCFRWVFPYIFYRLLVTVFIQDFVYIFAASRKILSLEEMSHSCFSIPFGRFLILDGGWLL